MKQFEPRIDVVSFLGSRFIFFSSTFQLCPSFDEVSSEGKAFQLLNKILEIPEVDTSIIDVKIEGRTVFFMTETLSYLRKTEIANEVIEHIRKIYAKDEIFVILSVENLLEVQIRKGGEILSRKKV